MKLEPETILEMKEWINNATYEELLERVRFAPVGSPWFCNVEVSNYYFKVMAKKGQADPDAAIAASKKLGWGTK